ncbi:unnamed protein product [Brugia timori]|uniref:Neur_chan_memb domain-containing protein n=1 Tax=Brugia timori TaxID=42155 RepID=A0A0R3QR93_9BILA|nr:unnamed protein product [Brugia timori]
MMIVSAHISIVRAYTLLRSNIIPKRQLMPYSADEWSFSVDFFVNERNDHFPHERFRRRSAKSFLVPVITFWILYTVAFTVCIRPTHALLSVQSVQQISTETSGKNY